MAGTSPTETAQEHLRIIRSLLERSTIYQTISAPTALVGGLLALVLSWYLQRLAGENPASLTPKSFLAWWIGTLALVAVINTVFLFRDARSRHEPFFSAGMRTALAAFLPPMIAGGFTGTAAALGTHDCLLAAALWMTFYGLALLATAAFAPPSLRHLGLGFVVLGLMTFAHAQFRAPLSLNDANVLAVRMMGHAFGWLHVAYAVAVFIHLRFRRR